MPALSPHVAAAAEVRVLERLSGWPEVVQALRAPGGPLHGPAPPVGEELENRVGTWLMARWRDSGGADDFEALYAFARPAVQHWIQSLLRRGLGHLDVAELLQDTFVNVYRYPRSFREEHAGSFRVWVRTIAGNIVRRAGARAAAVSFQQLPEGLREPADERGGPQHDLLMVEQHQRLRQAWLLFLLHYGRAYEELATRDRRALHLVEVEGLSYEEAGRALGVRRSNMKMIVFRSRKRISTRMRLAMLPPRGDRDSAPVSLAG
jgi:RNA polymerase sigma-70 factor (ECF subfamily)